jgi:hypothetical protein
MVDEYNLIYYQFEKGRALDLNQTTSLVGPSYVPVIF